MAKWPFNKEVREPAAKPEFPAALEADIEEVPAAKGENPLRIDSKPPKISFEEFAYAETRWKMLTKSKPEAAKELLRRASEHIQAKWKYLEQISKLSYTVEKPADKPV